MQAFEFLQKLITDKQVVPGFLSLKAADARSRCRRASRNELQRALVDPGLEEDRPDWKYAMGPMPTPDGAPTGCSRSPRSAPTTVGLRQDQAADVAGQILNYMGRLDGQKMLVILSQGNLVSLNEEYNKAADQPGLLDANAKVASSWPTRS